jgi:myo-inositol-1(or 4)-monophosphatase
MHPTLAEIETLARQAGEILRERFGQEHELTYKSTYDMATEADHASEDFLVGSIQARFPGDPIVTEESGVLEGRSANGWFIDPLDGTINFTHGVPLYSVSIGYASQGTMLLGAIYDPSSGECFTAERGRGAWLNGKPIHVSDTPDLTHSLLVTGFPNDHSAGLRNNIDYFSHLTHRTQGVRRLGSAAIDACWVACGRLDGFWEVRLNAWDIAAGALIASEAGAVVSTMTGDPDFFHPPFEVLVTNPSIHPQIVAAFHEAAV